MTFTKNGNFEMKGAFIMGTMSVITVPLKTRIYEEDIINKRMELCRKIYNNMLHDRLKALRKMEHDKDYIASKEVILSAYKIDNESEKKKIKKSQEYKNAQEIQKQKMLEYGFSEFAFISFAYNFIKPFTSNVTSTVASYSIAKPMWVAFSNYFFSNGQMVHFKSFEALNSLASDGKAGLKLVGTNKKSTRKPDSPFGLSVMFGSNRGGKVITMPLIVDKEDLYMQEMICHNIKVVRLVRKKINGRYKYYVQLTVDCPPAIKYDRDTGEIKNPINDGNVGIFIDTRKITFCSKSGVKQIDLINKKQIEMEEKLADINRFLDTSRRISNPENFNEDGTFKKGIYVDGQKTKLRWTNSNNYLKAKNKKANIQRKLAEQRKIRAGEIANLILSQGNNIICNKYNFKSAQMRKKETEINEDGKILSKAKAGKNISYSAPAMLLTIIDNKLSSAGYDLINRVETDKDIKISDRTRIMMAQELFLRLEN